MLVGERMSSPVITLEPKTPVSDALMLFREKRIRRAPVISHHRLVGIVAERDLLFASPSPVSSLSVWELNYLLSKLTVDEVMTRQVITVTEDTPIEEAARVMADRRVGGLPVMRGHEVVGIITETDLFRILLELMSVREHGVRVTALLDDRPGMLARLSAAIFQANGNFISFGQFDKEDGARLITFKVSGLSLDRVKDVVEPIVRQVFDIREV
jgi:acetoin utilization protein AcuB